MVMFAVVIKGRHPENNDLRFGEAGLVLAASLKAAHYIELGLPCRGKLFIKRSKVWGKDVYLQGIDQTQGV